jgi:hypothetical protein
MAQFRKKAVIIEARQWDGSEKTAKDLIAWMGAGNYHAPEMVNSFMYPPTLHVVTLEDGADVVKHVASVNDWIIRGVKGEFYPCKPDIFEMTYEIMEIKPYG